MTTPTRPKPLILMILDGYGISPIEEGNAVLKARQPNMDSYMRHYPFAVINAGGIEVGLPWGEMGNSETGHQNIGSGQVVYQALPRINRSIDDGSFFSNPAFMQAVKHVQNNPEAALHIMGLLSNGGVHSHIDHQLALLNLAAQQNIGERTIIHAFLDGRDSPPESTDNFVRTLNDHMQSSGAGRIQTLIGRYYAMDRNNNWERTKEAYDMLVQGTGTPYASWEKALEDMYENANTKNFETAPPSVIQSDNQNVRPIRDGDAVIFYNYRPDRARQLTAAFVDPDFQKFETQKWENLLFVTMTEYDKKLPSTVAIPEQAIDSPLGEVISNHGLTQMRVAETEKYAHVTYFFDGGKEEPFPGQKNVLIESHTVKDMSEVPKMKAREISDTVIQAIQNQSFDVIIMNYANPDMIGHTGNFDATVQAIEFLDEQVGRVVDATIQAGGAVLITCDHGNAESIIHQLTQKRSTDHTNNPVPLIYIAPHNKQDVPKDDATLQQASLTPIGVLADVAPTALEILQLPKPKTMITTSLLKSLM